MGFSRACGGLGHSDPRPPSMYLDRTGWVRRSRLVSGHGSTDVTSQRIDKAFQQLRTST